MTTIKGVLPVLPTPFDEFGRIDVSGLTRIIDWLVDVGVDGVTMFGVASEFYKLSDDERNTLLEAVISGVAGRVDTIVSVTSHATVLATRQAKEAEQAGANAIMLLPPFFASPEPKAILAHIQTVLSAVSLPVVLQYAPIETKLTIPADLFGKLSETSEGRLHVKVESVPSGPLVSFLTALDLPVLVGKGGISLFESLKRGAIGVMPGCSFADRFVTILRDYRAGQTATAWLRLNELLPYLVFVDSTVELFLAAEKHVLERRGLIISESRRLPTWQLDDIQREMIDTLYEQVRQDDGNA